MASPQLENGHTRIANEILEALEKCVIPSNQMQVLLHIIRKTYGFQKKFDWIANSQIAAATGLARSTVSRSLKYLEAQKLILRKKKQIGLQKDWERWKISTAVNSKADDVAKVDSAANSSRVDSTVNSEAKVDSCANSQELTALSTGIDSPATKKLTALSSLNSTKEIKETIQKKVYGEFKNVLLTDDEFQKLKDKFGSEAANMVEQLSAYVASKGKKYKSHYATILSWQRRNDGTGTNKHSRELPKSYSPPPSYHD